eukprot:1181956-Prorocentrum_minimum.AAC.9
MLHVLALGFCDHPGELYSTPCHAMETERLRQRLAKKKQAAHAKGSGDIRMLFGQAKKASK